jgi:pyrroline-5-carboxylate reductase
MKEQAGAIWLIGCGNMGRSILKGWINQGIDPLQVTVIDPQVSDAPPHVRLLSQVPLGEGAPALVVLAVKPQMLATVAQWLSPLVSAQTQLLSILAGVEVAALRAQFPNAGSIVRVMPNMAASIGAGASVILSTGLDEAEQQAVSALMGALGTVEWVDNEDLFHAVTALSGSGPAFVLRFLSAMAAGGEALGLAPDQALRLAAETLKGTAALALRSTESPETLVEQVRSPNGTTHAGLNILDADGQLKHLINETLAAAATRSRELAKAAQ